MVHVQAAGELSWARIKFSTVSPQTLVFKINELLPAFARHFGWGVYNSETIIRASLKTKQNKKPLCSFTLPTLNTCYHCRNHTSDLLSLGEPGAESSSLLTEEEENILLLGPRFWLWWGVHQLSHSPRGPTCWGTIYSTTVTRSWEVAASCSLCTNRCITVKC